MPHRLGFLLEGPTGTGKTSTILTLASHFDAQLKIVSLTSLSDSALMKLCSDLSRGSSLTFIIFEDADVLFKGREKHKGDINLVTFGGLLNAIDGLTSGNNRVTFITTNHVDKLDPALLRPGRVDVSMHLGNLDYNQACGMYRRFFEDDAINSFALEFTGKSAAEAQEELIRRYFNVPVVPELTTLCDLT